MLSRYLNFRTNSAEIILAVASILPTFMHYWNILKMFTSCLSTSQAAVFLIPAYRFHLNPRSWMLVGFLDLYRLISYRLHNSRSLSTKEEGLSIPMTWNSRCRLPPLLLHLQLPRCLLHPLRRRLHRKLYWPLHFLLTHHPVV